MSAGQKDFLSRWLPLLVAIISSVATIAISYGKLEQRLAPIEEFVRENTFEKHVQVLTPRSEFNAQKQVRDREVDELKIALREINQKLDRLIERGR